MSDQWKYFVAPLLVGGAAVAALITLLSIFAHAEPITRPKPRPVMLSLIATIDETTRSVSELNAAVRKLNDQLRSHPVPDARDGSDMQP